MPERLGRGTWPRELVEGAGQGNWSRELAKGTGQESMLQPMLMLRCTQHASQAATRRLHTWPKLEGSLAQSSTVTAAAEPASRQSAARARAARHAMVGFARVACLVVEGGCAGDSETTIAAQEGGAFFRCSGASSIKCATTSAPSGGAAGGGETPRAEPRAGTAAPPPLPLSNGGFRGGKQHFQERAHTRGRTHMARGGAVRGRSHVEASHQRQLMGAGGWQGGLRGMAGRAGSTLPAGA